MSTADLPIKPISPGDLLGPPGAAALERLRQGAAGQGRDALVRAAKDFESVFLHKMLEEMKNSIPDSGLLTSSTGKQLQGMFWSFLARDIAEKGGLGMWKDLYRQFEHLAGDADGAAPGAVEQLL